MNIEKLCKILKQEFPWVFCDTCINEKHKNCGECSKKKLQEINWELSDDAALEIALRIRKELEGDEEWIHSLMKQLP